MELICYANHSWVPLKEAGVSLLDLGLKRGYAVFDFIRVSDGTPLFLSRHIDRFFQSAKEMRLDMPCSKSDLHSLVHEIIRINQVKDAGVRMLLTGGNSPDGIHLGKPQLFIVTEALTAPPEEMRTEGYRLVSYPYRRHFPLVKTTDYTMELWLRPMIEDHRANDYHRYMPC